MEYHLSAKDSWILSPLTPASWLPPSTHQLHSNDLQRLWGPVHPRPVLTLRTASPSNDDGVSPAAQAKGLDFSFTHSPIPPASKSQGSIFKTSQSLGASTLCPCPGLAEATSPSRLHGARGGHTVGRSNGPSSPQLTRGSLRSPAFPRLHVGGPVSCLLSRSSHGSAVHLPPVRWAHDLGASTRTSGPVLPTYGPNSLHTVGTQ